jgi:type I restriction enzyme, S subunit
VKTVALRSLFADSVPSVGPAQFASETFELWSIPSYDIGKPEKVVGSAVGSSKKLVQPNDILLSRIIPHIRRAWVVGQSDGARQIASTEWIVFRSPHVDPQYLRHFFLSDPFHIQFMQTVAGVGGSLLRARPENVGAINLLLLPLDEQRRIATILDQADDLRRKRRQALNGTRALVGATFLDMFGDPALNPRAWPTRTLGAASIRFSDGPFGSNLKTEHYVETGVRVIRLQNIGVGEFVDKDKAFISASHFSTLQKHTCLPGDILIGTLGDPNLRAVIQPNCISVALNKADCVQMRVNPEICTPEYVAALLNCPSTEKMAQNKILGQTRLRISMGRLREFSIPIPPLDLQRAFAACVAQINKLKAHHHTHLARLDELFASLQHRAFRGEL